MKSVLSFDVRGPDIGQGFADSGKLRSQHNCLQHPFDMSGIVYDTIPKESVIERLLSVSSVGDLHFCPVIVCRRGIDSLEIKSDETLWTGCCKHGSVGLGHHAKPA